MRKGSDVIGKSVITYDTGQKIAKVLDLIFDQDSNQLLAFLVDEGGWLHSAQVIPVASVQAIGPDGLLVPAKSAVVSVKDVPEIQQILRRDNVLRGTRILTTNARHLGTMVDLYFDEQTGEVEGYEVSGGLFTDAYSGRSFVPAPQTLRIGEQFAFVPLETADLMREQVGGLRGAMQAAGDRLQATTELASGQLQEAARLANEKWQATGEVASEKFQEASRKAQEAARLAGEGLQETGEVASGRIQSATRRAAASLTNVAVSPEEQRAFVLGKPVDRDVFNLDGTLLVTQGQPVSLSIAAEAERQGVLDRLYRATGGNLSAPLNREANRLLASQSLEQALGRRIQRTVRTEEGLIVAALGQIVTEPVLERARTYRQEPALLAAVGLTTGEAMHSSTSGLLADTGEQLRGRAALARERVGSLWDDLRVELRDLQRQSAYALEERRIKRALGHPATRVILNPQDNVILNAGELITHRAIERARQAGVLDILLSSVSTREPRLSEAELRAPERGEAALPSQSTLPTYKLS